MFSCVDLFLRAFTWYTLLYIAMYHFILIINKYRISRACTWQMIVTICTILCLLSGDWLKHPLTATLFVLLENSHNQPTGLSTCTHRHLIIFWPHYIKSTQSPWDLLETLPTHSWSLGEKIYRVEKRERENIGSLLKLDPLYSNTNVSTNWNKRQNKEI